MSYCRWSSDNFHCDLYCYEDVSGGYTTHVASNRVVGDIPKLLPYPLDETPESLSTPGEVMNRLQGRMSEAWQKWFERHQEQMDWLEKNDKREPIGLPYDGESFNDPDLASFHKRLLHLREVGYRFPDYVLKIVEEEIEDERTAQK